MKKESASGRSQEPQPMSPAPAGRPDPLGPSAMYGVTGDLISTIGPNTESEQSRVVGLHHQIEVPPLRRKCVCR